MTTVTDLWAELSYVELSPRSLGRGLSSSALSPSSPAGCGFNTRLLRAHPFDPHPFIPLNLVLSCIAALQAPVMTSQNRQAERDRLHKKIDGLLTAGGGQGPSD